MEPIEELDPRYGEEGAPPTPWAEAEQLLRDAPLSWLASLRPGAGPHATPLITAWCDGLVHFTTGPEERKARNLRADSHCTLITGANDLHGGIDVVLEGTAERIARHDELVALQQAFLEKYGEEWHFDVGDGVLRHGPGEAWAFRLVPKIAYAFAKDPYSHTRYRF
jgi:hypothetical protein